MTEASVSAQRRAKKHARKRNREQTIAIIRNAFGITQGCADYLLSRVLYTRRNNEMWSAGLQNAIIQLDQVKNFDWTSLKSENENQTFAAHNIPFDGETIKSFVNSEQEGWTIVKSRHSKNNFAGVGLYAPF